VVIVLNTEHAAAFVAKDVGDLGPDEERRFDFVYTYDRSRVITAARAFLRQELLARLG
jgi:DICT domain-containing protein